MSRLRAWCKFRNLRLRLGISGVSMAVSPATGTPSPQLGTTWRPRYVAFNSSEVTPARGAVAEGGRGASDAGTGLSSSRSLTAGGGKS
mmetsp:Transcript_54491/g.176302  ORF Transcript_54491/g.176302 Transcript_54491/m.176302 type:complete len:88 (-) Transcript_54491:877-1140(-)